MNSEQIQDGLEARNLLELIGDVVLAYHVTLDEACSKCRTKQIVTARHAAWSRLRGLGFSYPEIAALWGVNHMSVLRALQRL